MDLVWWIADALPKFAKLFHAKLYCYMVYTQTIYTHYINIITAQVSTVPMKHESMNWTCEWVSGCVCVYVYVWVSVCLCVYMSHIHTCTVIITVQACDSHNIRLHQHYIIMITSITRSINWVWIVTLMTLLSHITLYILSVMHQHHTFYKLVILQIFTHWDYKLSLTRWGVEDTHHTFRHIHRPCT